ncbi:MAG: hypothetical protein HY720_31600 [Planctomycetes bacterium]|nr:hypothetical protein [Planctomycetota bacterium]
MKTSIGDGISTGLAALKSNPVAYIVGCLIVGVGCSIPLVNLAVGGPLYLGYIRMVAKGQRGQPVELNDIFEPLKTSFGPAWVASFIGFAVVLVAYLPFMMLMFVLPRMAGLISFPMSLVGIAAGFFVMTYMSHLAVRGTYDWKKTLQETLDFLKTDTAGRLIYLFVLMLVGGVGVIACGVGYLVTLPIGMAGIVAGIGREIGALEAAAPAPAAPAQPAV